MGKFSNAFEGETVIFEVTGWYVKSFINAKTGTIILTNKRVAFVEEKQIVGGGLLVAAADAALGVSNPKLKADIPFDQLSHWEHPKKNDIKIFNAGGEGFTFRAVPYDVWNAKLEELTGKKAK